MPEGRAPRRAVVLAWQIAIGALIVILWQWLVSVRVLDPFFVSRPSDIGRRIATWVVTGTIWRHLAVTLQEAFLGLVLGAVLGIVAGILILLRR